MVIELLSRTTHSLKEKRRIISAIKDKLKQKFNISIIESGLQDAHQQIQLGIAMVADSKHMIEKTFIQIEDFILQNYPVQTVAIQKEYS